MVLAAAVMFFQMQALLPKADVAVATRRAGQILGEHSCRSACQLFRTHRSYVRNGECSIRGRWQAFRRRRNG